MNEHPIRHDDHEPAALALLGVFEPDGRRDARVRARCHAVLEKRRRRSFPSARAASRRALEPILVGGACAAFLVEVLSRAVRLYRF